jgi:hypothetical protein
MFTKRHEQELAEIKALIHEVGQRFQEIVEQLERIQKAQEELAAREQPPAPVEPTTVGEPKAAPAGVTVLDAAPEPEPGARKARRRQSQGAAAVADARSGKRRGAAKRGRATTAAADDDTLEGDNGGKRRAAGARKRRPRAERAPSAGSDEG